VGRADRGHSLVEQIINYGRPSGITLRSRAG
jgi:hypothetical protein